MFSVNPRHIPYKTALLLLMMGGGTIAGAGAALKVDFRQVVHGLLQVVGIRSDHASTQQPREIVIGAGNELTVDGGVQRITPITPDEVARRLAWAGMYDNGGWLNFRGQSLEVVVAEFNRHNKCRLRVGDPQTGRLLVGGSFRDDDLDGFVAALAVTHGVRATRSLANGAFGDEIILDGGHSAGSTAIPGMPEPDPASTSRRWYRVPRGLRIRDPWRVGANGWKSLPWLIRVARLPPTSGKSLR